MTPDWLSEWWSARVEVYFTKAGSQHPYTAHVRSDDTLRIGWGASPREAIIDALTDDPNMEVPA
jgi:hypothetical protein